ncbi:MAG: helix-turn-helix domain-containing protein [Acidimicrobiia bacterium]|nr:helix-turn-helix domain-containing protein [Acidimicrobiia bacterium]
MQTRNRLRECRERRGISAAALAREAGVSRQTIYAMEAGSYVPNTTVALELARALEASVEELFWLEGEAAAPQMEQARLLEHGQGSAPGQSVQLCRVGKQLIAVPVSPHPVYLPPADAVLVKVRAGSAHVRTFGAAAAAERRVLVAGCDPGISVLARHLLETGGVELIAAPGSSRQALQWLKEGLVHAAGTHLEDNDAAVARLMRGLGYSMVTLGSWEQGLLTAPRNPKKIYTMKDLRRADVRLINREPGAGSRDLLERLLREAKLSPERVRGWNDIAYGHLPAAWKVALGEADCCVATRSAAIAFGLHFMPLAVERYDLVMRRKQERHAGVKALLASLEEASLRRKLEALAGYDTRETGAMR